MESKNIGNKFYTLEEARAINTKLFRGYSEEDIECFGDLIEFFKHNGAEVRTIGRYIDSSIAAKDSGYSNTIGLACIGEEDEISNLAMLLDSSAITFANLNFNIKKITKPSNEIGAAHLFNLEKQRGFLEKTLLLNYFLPKLEVDAYLLTKEQFEKANQ